MKLFLMILLFFSSNAALAKTKHHPAAKIEKTTVKNNDSIAEKPATRQIDKGFANIIDGLLPTVVNVSAIPENITPVNSNTIDQILNDHLKKESSIGSGFIISKDGLIVTSYHVISDSKNITVALSDDTKYPAELVGFDKKTDVALLKITSSQTLKYAVFGDSSKSRIGDWTIVVGNPYGLGQSASVGIISAKGRSLNNGQMEEFIQTDAAINSGNSGGPMFNLDGEVIGLSTAIFSPSGGNIGIGFALPSSTVSQVIKQLKDQGEVSRGWLGISAQDISEEIADAMKLENNKGAFITDVFENEPASKAGIVPSDVIVKFNDQDINNVRSLLRLASNFPVGKTAKVIVIRNGAPRVFNVVIGKMKDGDSSKPSSRPTVDKKTSEKKTIQILGMIVAENKAGLQVTEVLPKSEAMDKKITAGDLIISANQTQLDSFDNFKNVVEITRKNSAKLFLVIKRGGNNYPVVLTKI